MTRLIRNRGRGVIVAALAFAGVAAAALAFWAASGSGNATTQLGSPVQLTLNAGIPQGRLAPGGTSSVHVVATNTNSYFVTVNSLALNSGEGTAGFAVDAGHSGCDLAAIHFTAQPPPVGIFGPGWRVPPRVGETNGTLAFEIGGALSMDAGASDACQGAAFTIHLVAGS